MEVQSNTREMESISRGEAISISKHEKICDGCKTSKTPLWRSGPAGPKSLCNACGIRYRKKKGHVGAISDNNNYKKDKHPPPRSPSPSPSRSSSSSSTTAGYTINRGDDCGAVMRNDELKKKLRIKLVALGKEIVLLQRQRSPMKKVKRRKIQIENEYKKLGEVEQAAFLLMSLSCGSVFA